MKLVILEKPGRFTAKDFKSNLEFELRQLTGDLSASANLDSFSAKGWAKLDLSGRDCEIVAELAARKFGGAQTELPKVELHGVYDGIIVRASNDGLEADIGIDAPAQLNVKVRVEPLRAQLADGKPLPLSEIARDYCLLPGIKTSVRISRIDHGRGLVEGWLSDSHIEQLSFWIRTGLDQIRIPDCFQQQAESVVRKTRIERDVVAIESATLTTQSVVCKLGTDAVGLIPKLGSVLRNHQLNPFIPKRILTRCRPW